MRVYVGNCDRQQCTVVISHASGSIRGHFRGFLQLDICMCELCFFSKWMKCGSRLFLR